MSKLTNMYYSQYDSSIESETAYDSDNSDVRKLLRTSPSHAKFYEYIDRRNDEEVLHEKWKYKLREQTTLAKEIKEQCGMAVNLTDNRVCYFYKPVVQHIPGMKFKITFNYVKLLRKWYISLGHSRLPHEITLNDKVKDGTYDPISRRILKMIYEIKDLLDTFIQKLEYICTMVDNMKEVYKDIEFQVNESLTKTKIILKEKSWPKGIQKTSTKDIIILDIVLDNNFKADNLSYEYEHHKDTSAQQKRMCIFKLEEKIKIFFYLPLVEAFNVFME